MAGSRRRILVTRPEPGASRTAAALRQSGFEPVMVPVTQIVPLPVEPQALHGAAQADVIAVTSANALRHAPRGLLVALADKPLFAVGKATAAAALGFKTIQTADGDAEALARLLIRETASHQRVVYLCGRTRTGVLEEKLWAADRSVLPVETYQSHTVSRLTQKLRAIWQQGVVDGVVVHAGTAAAAIAQPMGSVRQTQMAQSTVFFLISARAAVPLSEAGIGPIIVSEVPTDAGLIAAVRAHWAA